VTATSVKLVFALAEVGTRAPAEYKSEKLLIQSNGSAGLLSV